jgi:hypothetical protein
MLFPIPQPCQSERTSSVILSEDSMILSLTTVHENDGVIPLLAKEGPGVVDCWATTPYPLLLRRRGAIFIAAKNLCIS